MNWEELVRVDSSITNYIDVIEYPCVTASYRVKPYDGVHTADGDIPYSETKTINLRLNNIASYGTDGIVNDIFIDDWKAYTAENYNGFRVYDCQNPTEFLEHTSDFTIPDRSIAVYKYNNFSYIASQAGDSSNGILNVVDVSIPNEQVLFSSVATNGIPLDITVEGDHTFIADDAYGVSSYFTGSNTPYYMDSINLSANVKKIYIQYPYLYAMCGVDGVKIINITDPFNLSLLAEFTTIGSANDIVIYDDTAFIADGNNGLAVFNVIDPEFPSEITNISTEGYSNLVDLFTFNINETFLCISDSEKGLLVLDITDSFSPVIIGSFEEATDVNSMFIYSSYAFMTDDLGIRVVQIKP